MIPHSFWFRFRFPVHFDVHSIDFLTLRLGNVAFKKYFMRMYRGFLQQISSKSLNDGFRTFCSHTEWLMMEIGWYYALLAIEFDHTTTSLTNRIMRATRTALSGWLLLRKHGEMNQIWSQNANIHAVNLICSSCSLIFRQGSYLLFPLWNFQNKIRWYFMVSYDKYTNNFLA